MKKIIIIIVALVFFGAFFLLVKKNPKKNSLLAPTVSISVNTPAVENKSISQSAPPAPTDNQNTPTAQDSSGFQPPLDRASERVTKKPFGIYITPKTSPVQPERFQGFHTGTDFEIFPEKLDADVLVRAICSGKIAVKRIASGYGGVLVQNCELNNQPATVIYGHLKLASIAKNAGDTLGAGDEIGILGKTYSSETDSERSHLHLGIHKGSAINILGYVQSQSELSGWIDPCILVCK